MSELYLLQYSFWAKEYVTRNEDYLAWPICEKPDTETGVAEGFVEYAAKASQSLERFGFLRGRDEKTSSDVVIRRLISKELLLASVRYHESTVNTGGFSELVTDINNEVLKIEIDLSHPVDQVLKDVNALVVNVYKLLGDDLDTDSHRNLFLSIAQRTTPEALESEKARVKSVSGFNPSSAPARAIGLWVWDYLKEHGGSQKKAITALHCTGHLSGLELETVEDSDLRFYFRRTDDCIKAAEVLSFSKKGTQNPNRVPGTRE